ncbi:MAG: hypothetical protein ACPHCN_09365 [Mycobacterium sp.]
MAYSSQVKQSPGAPNMRHVTISESDAEAASEVSQAIAVPERGCIVGVICTLVSGAGTTVLPGIGKAPGWTAGDKNEVLDGPNGGTAAARINDQTPVNYYAPGGFLYWRSGVDGGTDNIIVSELLILPHWEA